jgi:hypothetical protein
MTPHQSAPPPPTKLDKIVETFCANAPGIQPTVVRRVMTQLIASQTILPGPNSTP